MKTTNVKAMVAKMFTVGLLAAAVVMAAPAKAQAQVSFGVRVAAPTIIALLLATIVLGLIGRTMPQLNILVLGFGINAMVTSAVLAASIGAAAYLFQDYFDPVLKTLLQSLRPG